MKDGGPAFPSDYPNDQYDFPGGGQSWVGAKGMSIRDVFVTAIAAGDWASQSSETGDYHTTVSDEILNIRAKLYGRMADAMLKERKK